MSSAATPRFATELERELYEALREVMAAFRNYQSRSGTWGLRRIAAAEEQANAALAKADTTEDENDDD